MWPYAVQKTSDLRKSRMEALQAGIPGMRAG
jgi:hypothetical protein